MRHIERGTFVERNAEPHSQHTRYHAFGHTIHHAIFRNEKVCKFNQDNAFRDRTTRQRVFQSRVDRIFCTSALRSLVTRTFFFITLMLSELDVPNGTSRPSSFNCFVSVFDDSVNV